MSSARRSRRVSCLPLLAAAVALLAGSGASQGASKGARDNLVPLANASLGHAAFAPSGRYAGQAAAISRVPSAGPPTALVSVRGTGFGVSEAVDVFFDTEDLALAATDSAGSFGPLTFHVPRSASPGIHWLTAVGRRSGLAAQASFLVRTNWAQFHFGPRHRGANPHENVLNRRNVSGLNELWTGVAGNSIFGGPVVANGIVYVGSFDGRLSAFPTACGSGGALCSPLWTATVAGAILSSPAVANGLVYVGLLDFASGQGVLSAFPAACGIGGAVCSPSWTARIGGIQSSSPTVASGKVYVGSNDGNLYAFRAACGSGGAVCSPLWTGHTGAIPFSSPAVAGGVVYVGAEDNKLYAFAADCGSGGAVCLPLWTGQTTFVVDSSPAVANGIVYVGSGVDDEPGTLYAFPSDCGTGGAACSPLWTAAVPDSLESSPAVVNGVVYINQLDGTLFAFPANCGTGGAACSPLWTAQTQSPGAGNSFSAPAVANGVVYIGSPDGRVLAFRAACGTGGAACAPLWSAQTGAPVFATPVVADGKVYVATDAGRLRVYGLTPANAPIPRPKPAELKPDYALEPGSAPAAQPSEDVP